MENRTSLAYVPISQIQIDDVRLRDPDKKDERWPTFVADIRANGILKPLLGRRVNDKVIVIDGGHRLEAAREIGMEQIPVNIVEAQGDEVLELQISANFHKFDTKPAQYAKQLNVLIAHNPGLTLTDWAERLHVGRQWLDQRLSLLRLTDDIQTLVNSGQIGVANAIMLAKLPEEEQPHWVDRAQSMSFNDFAPQVQARANDLKKKNRGERSDEFVMVPKQRKFAAVRDAMTSANNHIKATWSESDRQGVERDSLEYWSGYWDGLRFACSMSDADIESAQADWEQQKLERAKKEEQKRNETLAKTTADDAMRLLIPKGKQTHPTDANSLAATATPN